MGWPGFVGMEPEAAAGARVGAGLALRLANKLAATLALLHGSLRVQRTHARGHLVTGASPATSPCGGAFRLRWRERPGGELVNEAWGKRCSGSPRFFWCCWRGRGGTGSGESTEGSFGGRRRNGDGGGVAGLPEGRGSVGRKEGVEAELVGVSERLGVAGGHERARRRRRVCSVAARERARGGEGLGERVRGLGGRVAV